MIAQADAVRIPLPDKSIHCCVISPPYWGLRKYSGDQGRIWGGDPECEHEWGPLGPAHHPGQVPQTKTGNADASVEGQNAATGQYCSRCGAWYGSLGLEPTPEQHIENIVEICREVRRVLRDDGVFWLNYGDCYAGSGGENANTGLQGGNTIKANSEDGTRSGLFRRNPRKERIAQGSLMMMPHRVALALQADGWIVRQAITWIKGSPMPESVNGWRWQSERTKTRQLRGNTEGRYLTETGTHGDAGSLGKEPWAEYEYGNNYELRRSSWRPSSATEMVFMLTKKMQYWGDAQSTRILSKRLNRFDSISENGREVVGGLWSGVSTESGDISFNEHLAPYWILACLFGLQGILIKQGNDLFRKIVYAAQTPIGARIGIGICAAIAENASSELLLKLLENINVIIAETYLNEGSVLMVSAFHSMPDNKRALAIKEACEMAPEIIANVEAIRNALTINASPEGIIDVDLIEHTIPFRDCLVPLAGDFSDFVIPQAVIEELNFLLDEIGFEEASSPSHSKDYTKTISGEGHNLWNWWFINTEAYPAAHYATFPRALVEPCILATCPRWACPVCGQGWAAVVDKTSELEPGRKTRGLGPKTSGIQDLSATKLHEVQTIDLLGYKPTCEHPHTQEEAVPGIVFDPFVGSGTTIAVAKQLLRRGIGIDISMEYLDQQAKVRAGLGTPSNALEDLPLFQ